jgi:hypothetical protein
MTESNHLSNTPIFEEGLERMNKAALQVGLQVGKEVLASRDEKVKKAQALLNIKNVLPEFVRWQLPVYLDRPSQLFITVAPPNVNVPTHSHNEEAGIRFIASGSIYYKGTKLTTGDWMYIPEGTKYEFETGPVGACMCYCYCCCCVPQQQ